MKAKRPFRGAATLALRLVGIMIVSVHVGCISVPSFPEPMQFRSDSEETVLGFDTNGDDRADFWQFQQRDGRKVALAYADESGQPGKRIMLDDIDSADCPHFLIALDGVPFELVDQLYREGRFRYFYPPARLVCCYPSMTDLALSDLFHTGRCLAFQARYFDRETNRLHSGNSGYLKAENSPWLAKMDYRCSFWWDGLAYLSPRAVFNHELKGIIKTLRLVDSGQACAYTVGTAGLGTRGGREAILEYLRTIDQLCEQIVFERHGRVKLTLTADHGHNLVENRRISFRKLLAANGYRQTKSLRKAGDVVVIGYGLVTYAAFFTDDPAGVAACLPQHEDVEFACYPSGDHIVVRDQTGAAVITKGANGFGYDSSEADPLELAEIVDELRRSGKVSDSGEIDEAALFDATLNHKYPDPLERIWRAFRDVVKKPPDVIANLRDGACYGSRFFNTMIGTVDSTHGSLNRMNSTTFVLTMLGELPPALRTRDVLPALEDLRSRGANPRPTGAR